MSKQVENEVVEGEEPVDEASSAEDSSEAETEEPRPALDLSSVFRLARRIVPGAWAVAVVACGVIWGIEVACLLFAAGALTLVITLMWSSVQSLTGGSALGFEEALGMGAPSTAEEQKRSVLRALKDLEYEKGVGKISAEDYAELSGRYRAEAKRLIQTMDEKLGPARQQVETALSKRLAQAGLDPAKLPLPNAASKLDAASATAPESSLGEDPVAAAPLASRAADDGPVPHQTDAAGDPSASEGAKP